MLCFASAGIDTNPKGDLIESAEMSSSSKQLLLFVFLLTNCIADGVEGPQRAERGELREINDDVSNCLATVRLTIVAERSAA